MAQIVPAERDLRRVIGDGETRSGRRGRRPRRRRTCSRSTARSCCSGPTTSARSSTTARAASAPTRSSGATRRCRRAAVLRARGRGLDLPELPRVGDRPAARDAGVRRSSPGGAGIRPAGGTRPTTTSPRSASRSRRTCRTPPGSPGGSGCAARTRSRSPTSATARPRRARSTRARTSPRVMRAPLDPVLQQQRLGDLDAGLGADAARRRSPTRRSATGSRACGWTAATCSPSTRRRGRRWRAAAPATGRPSSRRSRYRAAPHATADDPSAYIDPERVEEERANECVGRYERYLRRLGAARRRARARSSRPRRPTCMRAGIAAAEAEPPPDAGARLRARARPSRRPRSSTTWPSCGGSWRWLSDSSSRPSTTRSTSSWSATTT